MKGRTYGGVPTYHRAGSQATLVPRRHRAYLNWHRWFAWYPVEFHEFDENDQAVRHQKVWLKTIMRRGEYCPHSYAADEYRIHVYATQEHYVEMTLLGCNAEWITPQKDMTRDYGIHRTADPTNDLSDVTSTNTNTGAV